MSGVVVPFLFALRRRRLRVGAQEALALTKALTLGLHESSLEGFYEVSRALLVHREEQLDDFDQAFAEYFKGVAFDAKGISDELLSWLEDVRKVRELSDEEKAAIESIDIDELQRLFEQRLREQNQRHDGGNRWIGTGGSSPFGRGGFHPSGMRVGPQSGGGRSALKTADARRYQGYRTDLVFDLRQIEVALRRLRIFSREGQRAELDVEKTIDATAQNAGDLEVVLRAPRASETRVILMMDIGGSMDPFAEAASQLFSAARRASHWKELRTYYFHNCIYGRLYRTETFADPVMVSDLLRQCGPKYKVIFVGDALMAPYELLATSPESHGGPPKAGIHWLNAIRDHFPSSVWLNPEDPRDWNGNTVEVIRSVFPMFQLSVDGLAEAVRELLRLR